MIKKPVVLESEVVNQEKKDLRDNFISDRDYLDTVIANGTVKEKRMARIVKRILRSAHQRENIK